MATPTLIEQGTGTFGSRSVIAGSVSLTKSADRLIARGKKIAAVHFEADAAGHHVRGRAVRGGRHRPPRQHQGRGEAVLHLARRKPAGRIRLHRKNHRRAVARDVPERLPRLRSRDRSRHRRLQARAILRGRRCRARDQSAAGQRPDPWRGGAGRRPDSAREHRLRRRRPAAVGLVHGLRHAARARLPGFHLRQQ